MKHYNIPIFISHFGCPNNCVFCNQKKITGVETDITVSDIKNIIDEHLETLPKNSYKELSFFGGTFTGIARDIQIEYLETVKPYIDKGLLSGIRLSTRPDYISQEILENLLKYKVTTIELGVQSFDNTVLKMSERGYKCEDVFNATNLIKKTGINLGIQIMPGLPGSNLEIELKGIKDLIKINPDMVRIYPTLVIKNTKLEKMFYEGRYKSLSVEEAVRRVLPQFALIEFNNIKIIRVGLQPSDDLREDGVVVAGPFHSAFREVLETELYYKFFLEKLKEDSFLNVSVNEKDMSKVIGINKKNKIRLIDQLNIKEDNSILRGMIKINQNLYDRKDLLKNIL